jgi:hypothetical protein
MWKVDMGAAVDTKFALPKNSDMSLIRTRDLDIRSLALFLSVAFISSGMAKEQSLVFRIRPRKVKD